MKIMKQKEEDQKRKNTVNNQKEISNQIMHVIEATVNQWQGGGPVMQCHNGAGYRPVTNAGCKNTAVHNTAYCYKREHAFFSTKVTTHTFVYIISFDNTLASCYTGALCT